MVYDRYIGISHAYGIVLYTHIKTLIYYIYILSMGVKYKFKEVN